MSATDKGNILKIAPELSAITDDDVWTLVLADVAGEVESSVFGSKQEKAQRYLAAHYLTLLMPDNLRNPAAAGSMTSETAGKVSRSYGLARVKGQNRYDETSYGRVFHAIRRGIVIPFYGYRP